MKKADKTYADSRLQIGGLMRCCTATIGEFVRVNAGNHIEYGKIIDCKYMVPGNRMIIIDQETGNFRWNRL